MSIKEKNIEIALMLGWEFEEKEGEGYHGSLKGEIIKYKLWKCGVFGNDIVWLKFDSDANWQFEAIDWIEKQDVIGAEYASNYNVISNCFGCEIETTGYHSSTIIRVENQNRKEAIFEALYQFSQFLKQK